MSDALKHFLGNIRDRDELILKGHDMVLYTRAFKYDDSNVVRFACFDGDPILGWTDTGSLEVEVDRLQNVTAGICQGDYPAGSWVWDAEEIS